jgi:hypothetical protein
VWYAKILNEWEEENVPTFVLFFNPYWRTFIHFFLSKRHMITNMYLEIWDIYSFLLSKGSSELCYVGMSYNDWNILLRLIWETYHLVGLFIALLLPYLTSAIEVIWSTEFQKPHFFFYFLRWERGRHVLSFSLLKLCYPGCFFYYFNVFLVTASFSLVYSIYWQLVYGKLQRYLAVMRWLF